MTNTANETGPGVEYVDVDVEVGILVQSQMFRHRHRLEDLGNIIGVSAASVSRKVRGRQAFSLAELYKIGRAYNVDPAALLPRLDSNQQPCGYPLSQVSAPDTDGSLGWSDADRMWSFMWEAYAVLPADDAPTRWEAWSKAVRRFGLATWPENADYLAARHLPGLLVHHQRPGLV